MEERTETHIKLFPRPRTLIWQAWQYLTLQLSLPCPGRQRCPATPGPRLSSRALGSFVPAALLGPPGASILSVMGGHVPTPKQHFLYSLQGLLKRGLMFTFPSQCWANCLVPLSLFTGYFLMEILNSCKTRERPGCNGTLSFCIHWRLDLSGEDKF